MVTTAASVRLQPAVACHIKHVRKSVTERSTDFPRALPVSDIPIVSASVVVAASVVAPWILVRTLVRLNIFPRSAEESRCSGSNSSSYSTQFCAERKRACCRNPKHARFAMGLDTCSAALAGPAEKCGQIPCYDISRILVT